MNADGAALAADPLVLWLIVATADALFAGLPGVRAALGAPLALVDAGTRWLERKLNRAQRSVANRLVRGALLVVLLLALGFLAGWMIALWVRAVPLGWLVEGAVVAALLHQGRHVAAARAVRRALADHDLDRARDRLRRISPHDGAGLDAHGVARAAVESCAVRFCDGVVAPAFWYLLIGLPALCAVRVVNVAARRIGHGTPRYATFGQCAARLDDVLALLPALGAGVLIVVAGLFVPSANPARAFSVWVGSLRTGGIDAGRARGAVAGALGLALGGPSRIDGEPLRAPWIGDGRARATARDITRAVILFAAACILFAAILGAALLARGLG